MFAKQKHAHPVAYRHPKNDTNSKNLKKNGRILQTTHTKSLRKTVLPQFFNIPVRLRPVNRTQHIYLTRTPVGGMDMGHMGHRDTVQRYIRPGTGTGNPVRQRGGRLPMARTVPYVPDIPPPHIPVPYRNIRLVYICFGMDTAGQYMDISRFGMGHRHCRTRREHIL